MGDGKQRKEGFVDSYKENLLRDLLNYIAPVIHLQVAVFSAPKELEGRCAEVGAGDNGYIPFYFLPNPCCGSSRGRGIATLKLA